VVKAAGNETGFIEWVLEWAWPWLCDLRETLVDSVSVYFAPIPFFLGFGSHLFSRCFNLEERSPSSKRRKLAVLKDKVWTALEKSNYAEGATEWTVCQKFLQTLKKIGLPVLGLAIPWLFLRFSPPLPIITTSTLTPPVLMYCTAFSVSTAVSYSQGFSSGHRLTRKLTDSMEKKKDSGKGKSAEGQSSEVWGTISEATHENFPLLFRSACLRMGIHESSSFLSARSIERLWLFGKHLNHTSKVYCHFYWLRRFNSSPLWGRSAILILAVASYLMGFPKDERFFFPDSSK